MNNYHVFRLWSLILFGVGLSCTDFGFEFGFFWFLVVLIIIALNESYLSTQENNDE